MFICCTAYFKVHIINLSSVETSNFIHFTKLSDVLNYNEWIEKYENCFFKIYIFWHTHTCMWMYVVMFQ